MTKMLIYLDQSYLSGMVKGLPEMVELQKLLSRLVDEDRLVCPKSMVHDQETDLDDRIADRVHKVIDELSGAVPFRSYDEVLLSQTNRAFRRFIGLPATTDDLWQEPFDRDPHAPLRRPRLTVRIAPPAEWAESTRRMKLRVQEFSVNENRVWQQDRAGKRFEDLRASQLAGIIDWCFNSPSPDGTPQIMAIEFWRTVVDLFDGSETMARGPYTRFFASPDFARIPFCDIFASLTAGFQYHHGNRDPAQSDVLDFTALALALPAVDVVTTDQTMKRMLERLGLDRKYGVQVWSPTASDVQDLTAQISRLIESP